MKKQQSDLLLIVALIVSHFVVYKIEVTDVLLLKGIKLNIFPLIAFAGNTSPNQIWLSVITGYFLFCIYLLLNLKRIQKANIKFFYFSLIFCAGAFLFECFTIWKIYTGSYTGQHSRLGLLLFLLCWRINSLIYKSHPIMDAKSAPGNHAAS
jgi:hypothetical protein